MNRMISCSIAGVLAAACFVATSSRLEAIETTYGEDPVPSTGCYRGYINLGYGIDPVPAETPCERWRAWRASRGLPPQLRIFHRTSATSPRGTMPWQNGGATDGPVVPHQSDRRTGFQR